MSETVAGLPFREAITALRQRAAVLLPSSGWTDTLGEINNHGFAVAGAMKESLLRSIAEALIRAETEGKSVRDFQREFVSIAAKEGWSYRGSPGWRSRVIFETNLGQSYEAGKWQRVAQAMRDGAEPIVRYVARMDGATRPLHRQWNGTMLPASHAWWQTHSPKNGWGCRCTIEVISQAAMRARGWKVSKAPPVDLEARSINTATGPRTIQVPKGIDTGFGHSPGQRWMDAFVPKPVEGSPMRTIAFYPGQQAPADAPAILGGPRGNLPLPPPRSAAAERILPVGLPAEDYMQRFLAEFGAAPGQPAMFEDVIGSRLVISDEMFMTADGKNTADKQKRGATLLLSADAIKQPDEIWVSFQLIGEGAAARLRLIRRYIARFEAPDRTRSGFAVFEWSADEWDSVTAYDLRAKNMTADAMETALERQRAGVRVYRRGE